MFRDYQSRKIYALLTALVLVFSLAFSLTACGSGTDADVQGDAGVRPGGSLFPELPDEIVHAGKIVNSPSGVAYLCANKIEVNEIDADEDRDDLNSNSYIQISGLKDKKTEEKINKKLYAFYEENAGKIPAYRGIRAEFGDEPVLSDESYAMNTCTCTFNYNNLLSVIFTGSGLYVSQLDGWDRNVNTCKGITIDLNTGEEICIADCFCNDVNAFGKVNDVICEAISDSNGDEEGWYEGEGNSLKVTGPFKGIDADQPFYLSVDGICVLFNDETPAFTTTWGSYDTTTLVIPFTEDTAVGERFFSEDENIYESDDVWVKRFPVGETKREDILREAHEDDVYSFMWIEKRATASSGVPEQVRAELVEFVSVPDSVLREQFDPYVPEFDYYRDGYAYADRSAMAQYVGPYINVEFRDYAYMAAFSESADSVFIDRNTGKLKVYDMRGGKLTEMKFEDVFREGTDIEAVIKQAMIDTINDYVDSSNSYGDSEVKLKYFGEDGDSEWIKLEEEYIDRLYKSINGFEINYAELLLSFDGGTPYDIFQDVFGCSPDDVNQEYGWYYTMASMIEYDKLAEHLAIFDL